MGELGGYLGYTRGILGILGVHIRGESGGLVVFLRGSFES